jgi:hypothetical protein
MASRQAVLLTPLESFRTRLLPSRHRINRVHSTLSKKQPFSFHALAGCPFRNSFLFKFMPWMGGTLLPDKSLALPLLKRQVSLFPLSLLEATLTRHPISVHSKGLTENLTPLDATLTRNWGEGGTSFNPKTSPSLSGFPSSPYIPTSLLRYLPADKRSNRSSAAVAERRS